MVSERHQQNTMLPKKSLQLSTLCQRKNVVSDSVLRKTKSPASINHLEAIASLEAATVNGLDARRKNKKKIMIFDAVYTYDQGEMRTAIAALFLLLPSRNVFHETNKL